MLEDKRHFQGYRWILIGKKYTAALHSFCPMFSVPSKWPFYICKNQERVSESLIMPTWPCMLVSVWFCHLCSLQNCTSEFAFLSHIGGFSYALFMQSLSFWCISSVIFCVIPSSSGCLTLLPSLLFFSVFTFRLSVLPCRVSTKHLSIRELCLSLVVCCLFLSMEQKLVETNTWLSLCQLIMLEPWSQQVLTAAGCHNTECSLGGCNCQVTTGIVPKGLFKVVLWHSSSLQPD